jgi:hypothetical protein
LVQNKISSVEISERKSMCSGMFLKLKINFFNFKYETLTRNQQQTLLRVIKRRRRKKLG